MKKLTYFQMLHQGFTVILSNINPEFSIWNILICQERFSNDGIEHDFALDIHEAREQGCSFFFSFEEPHVIRYQSLQELGWVSTSHWDHTPVVKLGHPARVIHHCHLLLVIYNKKKSWGLDGVIIVTIIECQTYLLAKSSSQRAPLWEVPLYY